MPTADGDATAPDHPGYRQNAWVPQGVYATNRTSPTKKTLFVKYDDNGNLDYPFALGEAFSYAGIEVFVYDLNSTEPAPDEKHIDAGTISLALTGYYGSGRAYHQGYQPPWIWTGQRWGFAGDARVPLSAMVLAVPSTNWRRTTTSVGMFRTLRRCARCNWTGLSGIGFREDENDNGTDDKSGGKWESSGTRVQGVLDGDRYVHSCRVSI